MKDHMQEQEIALFQPWLYFCYRMALCTTSNIPSARFILQGRIFPVEAMRYDGLRGISKLELNQKVVRCQSVPAHEKQTFRNKNEL